MDSIILPPRALGPETRQRIGPCIGRLCKRTGDLIGSLCAILVFSPLFVIIAAAVKLQDAGPILYRRRVIGPRGEFDAYKFRSMRPDADSFLVANPVLLREFQQNFKLENDSRITRVGMVLRKYSLDELPQFVNVLKGEMSLVGPRMVTQYELAKYGEDRQLLLTVKPGLTGYWQVNGRQRVSYHERVQMDVFYIRNWSLVLDLHILLKTPVCVLKGEGAL